ncbi:hypothetical protein [Pseudomonas sp. AP3_22 TE3818]
MSVLDLMPPALRPWAIALKGCLKVNDETIYLNALRKRGSALLKNLDLVD